jgi:hypothetical protein
MAKRRLTVQHFIACPDIRVVRAAPDNPYTLRDVSYYYDVPGDQEWPVRLDDLWLYVRFFGGRRTRAFGVDVRWLDAPNRPQLICEYDPLVVYFRPGETVHSRAWRFGTIRYPGPGRYHFRLRRSDDDTRTLANEYISIRSVP